MKSAIEEGGVGAAAKALMRDAQVHDKGCRSCSIGNVGIKLDVSTLLTPASGNVGGLDLGGGEQELSQLLHCPIMRLLLRQIEKNTC